MSRRNAREIAFKLIFEYMFSEEKKPELIDEFAVELGVEDAQDDKAYILEVYNGVTAHYAELLEEIKMNTQNFELDRLFKVDRALLLLAIYEIKYMENIPFKVSVDEALSLAKKYSTEKSAKYINGVLSNLARE